MVSLSWLFDVSVGCGDVMLAACDIGDPAEDEHGR
jgi:hypothetical protein